LSVVNQALISVSPLVKLPVKLITFASFSTALVCSQAPIFTPPDLKFIVLPSAIASVEIVPSFPATAALMAKLDSKGHLLNSTVYVPDCSNATVNSPPTGFFCASLI
tara:strand:+ start:222 stop:542 length:321 start_codon:yes stop_codon:yes gene_type:complete